MDKETFEKIKDEGTDKVMKEYFRENLKSQERLAIRRLLEELLDEVMKAERRVFLESDSGSSNKANGYYPRSIRTGSFKLNLNVPRDRNGEFRPHLSLDRIVGPF